MTRPAKSSLVLDGNDIKLRLEAERTASNSVVHIDWLRFTCQLRNAPAPSVDVLFPEWKDMDAQGIERARILRLLAEMPNDEFAASTQAYDLAVELCQALGPDYTVAQDVRKGHDFYRYRWSLERNGTECGWVGYLSSGDSPRQSAQARTLHANLYGAACTFAAHGWNTKIAAIVDARSADITRTDLALDFFDGLPGGIEKVVNDYKNGLCDVGGKRLKSNCVGDWLNGNSRSLYFGSKEAGKQTNVYEKGHQLFGPESGSNWLRVELRYGNKLRVLSSDILRNPSNYFAGASPWHASMLALADVVVTPEPVKTTPRLALETVQAEVTKNVLWALHTAAPTIAAAWDFLGSGFLELVTEKKLPGRLQKFSKAELQRAFTALKFTPDAGVCHAF